MIPAPFEYTAPKTLEEALRIIERHGDEAKILAGGHSLLPLIKLRLAQPRYVVDIGGLRGMSYIREENGQIAIGALTTHADIESSTLLRAKCPLLVETAATIGDVQVRNRGTIGGSLAHADPAADYPATILALDAEMIAATTAGTRSIPAKEFFVDMLTTSLRSSRARHGRGVRKNASACLGLRHRGRGGAAEGCEGRKDRKRGRWRHGTRTEGLPR
jgi:carbon-monoxide dehydrogenase medium subunit